MYHFLFLNRILLSLIKPFLRGFTYQPLDCLQPQPVQPQRVQQQHQHASKVRSYQRTCKGTRPKKIYSQRTRPLKPVYPPPHGLNGHNEKQFKFFSSCMYTNVVLFFFHKISTKCPPAQKLTFSQRTRVLPPPPPP